MEVLQRPAHAVDRLQPGLRPGRQLGDHRVVEHRDLVALAHPGVVAHDIAAPIAVGLALDRGLIADQPADRRQEAPQGVLGIDPALDRPALDGQVGLIKAERLAGGDADHLLD